MSTILISGASGFIGAALAKSLKSDGHRVVPLSRRYVADAVRWSPEAGVIDREGLMRVKPDVVINLAGEPIDQRWTSQRRRRIRDSRVHGTAALAEALATLNPKPRIFVSGSAVGVYGAHRGDELLDESSAPGSDYLATTARDWERATDAATAAGIRVVTMRTGVVLGPGGGALARMLPVFRLGLGGRLGNGRQWMSWIARDDVIGAVRFVMSNEEMRGPVNFTAPEPVRNSEFVETLATALGKRATLPVPSLALELVFGRMARDTILASQRVIPKRLAGAGFEHRHPRLDETLRDVVRQ